MKSIGIYPGTFDPIHDGHIAFANAARAACGLDIIYFVPEKNPRNKTNVGQLRLRTEHIDDTIAKYQELRVMTLESDCFTVEDTMPEIESHFGVASYTLLIGSDVAQSLAHWPNIDKLLSTWNLAIGMRHADDSKQIEDVLKQIEDIYDISIRRTFIRTDKANISSSSIRG